VLSNTINLVNTTSLVKVHLWRSKTMTMCSTLAEKKEMKNVVSLEWKALKIGFVTANKPENSCGEQRLKGVYGRSTNCELPLYFTNRLTE